MGGSKTLIDCHTSNNGIDMNGIYMNIELAIIVLRKRNVERQELGSIINTNCVIF